LLAIGFPNREAHALDPLSEEFFGQSSLPVWILAMRLIGTVVLCGVIGLEREIKKDSAGLRTNILVGVAAATFALVTIGIVDTSFGSHPSVSTDPLRLVEAVTSGVAFLAAGIIVFAKGRVRGLTTGASMWLSASIGLAIGLGFWIIALMAATVGFIVLAVFRQLEVRFGIKDE
jgi:putative Mg2+ transporter-C (MgtC) family protein